MELDTTKTQRESPYLNELDIQLNMKRHHDTSSLNPSRNQYVNAAQTKYSDPVPSTDDPDIDEPLDDLGINEPIDVLDKIEACLLSDNSLINMHDIPEQAPPDLEYDGDDSFSHTDLDSLTSVSSSSSSCSSLRSSGEFDFALPGHELDSLSSMANNLSPFFHKLRAISNHLSNSVGKDLNTDSPDSSECSTLTKECQSATTSTSSIYWADSSDGYHQNGDKTLRTDAAPCSVNLVPDFGRRSSDGDSVFSQSTASARCSQNLDSWSTVGSSRSSQEMSSVSSLNSSPSDEVVALSNGNTRSTELPKPQIGTKRPQSLGPTRDGHSSVHSDRSSPMTHRSYDSTSPLTASHRVSIMSLKSAFSYLAGKGIMEMITAWI